MNEQKQRPKEEIENDKIIARKHIKQIEEQNAYIDRERTIGTKIIELKRANNQNVDGKPKYETMQEYLDCLLALDEIGFELKEKKYEDALDRNKEAVKSLKKQITQLERNHIIEKPTEAKEEVAKNE